MTRGTTGSVDVASASTTATFSNLFPGERYEVKVEAVSGTRMSSPMTGQVVTRTDYLNVLHESFHSERMSIQKMI